MKRKVSDIVADFLADKSVKYVFAISGGASLHLIHSIAEHQDIDYICCHHEQASAMAADAYSRVTNNIGVVLATSGPGATNLITGICGCFYDSVPLLAITGQVSTFRMSNLTGVRQIGFQETPIVDICKPIVKYATQILDPKQILYELEKSYQIAISGRKGPVLIDIPDNLQREVVDTSFCPRFVATTRPEKKEFEKYLFDICKYIESSVRPVIIAGWGVHLSESELFVIAFGEKFGIPIVTTWAAMDLLAEIHPLQVGTFGTHGQRHANFTIQNSDLIIAFGARLDTKATGTPINSFARDAKKIVIDIDEAELNKFEKFDLQIDIKICDDLSRIKKTNILASITANQVKFKDWHEQIKKWKQLFDHHDHSRRINHDGLVSPYSFFHKISRMDLLNTNIIFDTGCSIAWGMQAIKCKDSVRVYHDFNNTAMGWALPASIGAYYGSSEFNIFCIIGDGSLMMSLHELAVIQRHKIPIKIFIMNNSGYSMIQQTQEQWLNSNYIASSYEGGLAFPNFKDIAKAFSLEYFEMESNSKVQPVLDEVITSNKPCLCNILISSKERVIPQVKAGKPNEEMEPMLDRNVFESEMITKILTDYAE